MTAMPSSRVELRHPANGAVTRVQPHAVPAKLAAGWVRTETPTADGTSAESTSKAAKAKKGDDA